MTIENQKLEENTPHTIVKVKLKPSGRLKKLLTAYVVR
jgi:hypothetical protein